MASKEIIFYYCQICGRGFRNEKYSSSCCIDKPNYRQLLTKPKYRPNRTLFQCDICGLVHEKEEGAEECQHWSDDPEDWNEDKLLSEKDKELFKIPQRKLIKLSNGV